MNKEQKEECKKYKYMMDNFEHIIDKCNGDCYECILSYDYVLGVGNGYSRGYNDGYENGYEDGISNDAH